MSVEATPYQSLYRTLNIGSFPKDITEYEEPKTFLHEFIFIDYQLQSSLSPLSPGSLLHVDARAEGQIKSLIRHAMSVNSRYAQTNKSYLEVYYGSVVLAHLQMLGHDLEGAKATLNGFRIDYSMPSNTFEERKFLEYLTARYHALLGKCSGNSLEVWYMFLESMRRYGNTSQVSANLWVDSIFQAILNEISSNGTRPLNFKDLQGQRFAGNVFSFIPLANYALKVGNKKYVSVSFEKDYSRYVSDILDKKIKEKREFPDANDETSGETDFVRSLYQTCVYPHRRAITGLVDPKLSKKFLINMTAKTYQCQTILFHLIVSLLDLGEHDEALAAFKTYISYVERERVQTGTTSDILQVIDLYTLCISSFNPTKSFFADTDSSSPKFKFKTIDTVVKDLTKFTQDLRLYIHEATRIAEISHLDPKKNSPDPLSFLYHRFNPNMLMDKRSSIIQIISGALYGVGKFHEYLAKHGSANSAILKKNTGEVLLLLKSSLIINPSERFESLFDYTLFLAYENRILEAFTMSKFILNKYPKSFKTWNLLVLLATALKTKKGLFDVKSPAAHSEIRFQTIMKNDNPEEMKLMNEPLEAVSPEKLVEDALCIASSYISKRLEEEKPVPIQTAHEILQLKMTQLAVWESEYGAESILEHLADVFALYRDLFPGVSKHHKSTNEKKTETKGLSHPAISGVNMPNGDERKPQTGNHLTSEKLKKFSRLSMDSTDRKSNDYPREYKHDKYENKAELKILQDIWLWAACIYLKLGFSDEAEQCIIEAETILKPNVKTHTFLGLLTSKSRKKLALKEFERSMEIFRVPGENYDRKTFGLTLMGMSQLLITNGEDNSDVFISEKDRDAGLVRIKNYLETFSNCWPYGHNSAEVWYYLSAIYENFDDKVLQAEALWRCVELESSRPVRSFDICEEFTL